MSNVVMKYLLVVLSICFATPSLGLNAGFGGQRNRISSTKIYSETATQSTEAKVEVNPKEVVKVFGRLAEKYIVLDPSAGMCCYSGCSNCEYRLPGGGYRMPDQSAARPKWIPCYESRTLGDGEKTKTHETKWSTSIFCDGPSVSKETFIERVVALDYAPTLGGPFTPASKAAIEDTSTVAALFDILVANEKSKDDDEKPLTKFYMNKKMKEIAGEGQEGINWPAFIDTFER